MNEKKGNWLAESSDSFFKECSNIVNSKILFDNFKQNNIFTKIIGNDVRSVSVANQCLEKIKNSNLLNLIEKFKTNDKYGNPLLNSHEGIGQISGGTLYFIAILDDIINKIKDVKNLNIIEIGSGYGGQAKIILDYGVKNYTCVDVKEPLSLCKKYLSLFSYENVNFLDTSEIKNSELVESNNLVISNWCLSEFDNNGIKYYIDNIIKKCDYGYFLMNCWDIERQDFIKTEMAKHFSSISVIGEEIETHSSGNNFLLYIKK